MRGLDTVIALRRRGLRPTHIVLDCLPYEPSQMPMHLQYESGDTPELLDLRAVVGLLVVVMGDDVRTVDRWARACVNSKADRVLTFAGEWNELETAT